MAKRGNDTILYKGNALTVDEVSDVLHYLSGDVGTLCSCVRINAWAKFKPFRNAAIAFADAAAHLSALASARYGFGNVLSILSFSSSQASPEWAACYQKPQGCDNQHTEPYRLLDFVDLTANSQKGYNHNAVPPMQIEMPSDQAGISQGGSEITVKCDSYVTGWDSDTCIALDDVLPSAQLTQYKLAVLFKCGDTINVLVTSYLLSDLAGGLPALIQFSGISSAQGVTVPMLQTANEGDQITAKVCLIANQNAGVLSSYNGAFLSLNMLGGMDSKVLTFHEVDSIVGMSGSINASVTKGGLSSNMRTYTLDNIWVTLTPGSLWGQRTVVNLQFFINVSSGFFHAASASDPDVVWYGSSDTVRVLNSSSDPAAAKYVQAALSSNESDKTVEVLARVTAVTAKKIKLPCMMFTTGGGPATLTVSGFAFMGSDIDNPSFTVPFTPKTISLEYQ